MAPITRADIAPPRPALRRAVGLPVLLLALLVTLPWLVLQLAIAGLALAGGFLTQAADYAGQVALRR